MAERIILSREIEAVVFDWDGTLVDSVGPKLRQNKLIASKFGNELSLKKVRELWKRSQSFDELMALLTNNAPMDEVMREVEETYHINDFAKRKLAFTAEVLAGLRDSGYHTGIVTGLADDLLHEDAANLHLDIRDIDYVQTQEKSEFGKPDPRVFEPMKEHFAHLGIRPSSIVYVGDEEKDYWAATGAGLGGFIGVTTGMCNAEDFGTMGAEYVPNIQEIHPYVTV